MILTLLASAALTQGTPCVEHASLQATALATGDEHGFAVGTDGNYVAIGAPSHGGTGAVFVYFFNGSSWTQTATISPPELQSGDHFGYAVGMNDGIIAVGAPFDDNDALQELELGAVYTFSQNTEGEWTSMGVLYPDAVAHNFGSSVSVWGDTIVVGEMQNFLDQRVWVYRQTGAGWTPEGDADGAPIDTPAPGAAASAFGADVAVYQDTLLVGDDDYNTGGQGNNLGRAYVYRRTGSTWALTDTLENPSGDSDAEHFGESVALHGRWAFVGAPPGGGRPDYQPGRRLRLPH